MKLMQLKYQKYHIHPDHLGSFSIITDASGNIKQKCTFDAWGNRTFVTKDNTLIFDRGFTGHEHYEEFNLINMNGRMYDPIVGRFLSVDNYVQNPFYTQSFNRYSYCINNPLKYSDPTGMKIKPFYYDPRYEGLGGMLIGGAYLISFGGWESAMPQYGSSDDNFWGWFKSYHNNFVETTLLINHARDFLSYNFGIYNLPDVFCYPDGNGGWFGEQLSWTRMYHYVQDIRNMIENMLDMAWRLSLSQSLNLPPLTSWLPGGYNFYADWGRGDGWRGRPYGSIDVTDFTFGLGKVGGRRGMTRGSNFNSNMGSSVKSTANLGLSIKYQIQSQFFTKSPIAPIQQQMTKPEYRTEVFYSINNTSDTLNVIFNIMVDGPSKPYAPGDTMMRYTDFYIGDKIYKTTYYQY